MRSIVTPCSDIPGRRTGRGWPWRNGGGRAGNGGGLRIRQELTGPNVPGDGGKCPRWATARGNDGRR